MPVERKLADVPQSMIEPSEGIGSRHITVADVSGNLDKYESRQISPAGVAHFALSARQRRRIAYVDSFPYIFIPGDSSMGGFRYAWTSSWDRSAPSRHLEVYEGGHKPLRFSWMAIRPGAAQLLAAVNKIVLWGSMHVDSFDIGTTGQFCQALGSLLLGETGTHWTADPETHYVTPQRHPGSAGRMESLTELQLNLSIHEDEFMHPIVSRLPSLPATLTDVGLYFGQGGTLPFGKTPLRCVSERLRLFPPGCRALWPWHR